ncbi:MAG: hypothetical protein K0Q79_2801 [Flavipsychrobacter sp.]|jgi:hypothetical protein|nr:hypothetical protein [Flavipsychrobacter sp.]
MTVLEQYRHGFLALCGSGFEHDIFIFYVRKADDGTMAQWLNDSMTQYPFAFVHNSRGNSACRQARGNTSNFPSASMP